MRWTKLKCYDDHCTRVSSTSFQIFGCRIFFLLLLLLLLLSYVLFMSLFVCMFGIHENIFKRNETTKIFRTEYKEENNSRKIKKNNIKWKKICARHTIKVPHQYTYLKKRYTTENKWRMELNRNKRMK